MRNLYFQWTTLHWNDCSYKMFTKIQWPLIQVNLPLMFYLMTFWSLDNSTTKSFMILCYDYSLSWSTTQPLVFCHATSQKKRRPTHPPPICDIIIEKPLSFSCISKLSLFSFYYNIAVQDFWDSQKSIKI